MFTTLSKIGNRFHRMPFLQKYLLNIYLVGFKAKFETAFLSKLPQINTRRHFHASLKLSIKVGNIIKTTRNTNF